MRSPKSLHNLQHDEGGNYMAETETETSNFNTLLVEIFLSPFSIEVTLFTVCEDLPATA
jgi:hypothetical protein